MPTQAKLAAIKEYVPTNGIPQAALIKMAKLGAVIEGWMKETHCTISAIQCWTSMEEYFGVVPCTVMSMMSENLLLARLRDRCGGRAGHARAGAGQSRHRARCWTGTTTTARIRTSACASTARICRSISSPMW